MYMFLIHVYGNFAGPGNFFRLWIGMSNFLSAVKTSYGLGEMVPGKNFRIFEFHDKQCFFLDFLEKLNSDK